MDSPSLVDRLLKNMDNMHELGRQRAFELGNPFMDTSQKMKDTGAKNFHRGKNF